MYSGDPTYWPVCHSGHEHAPNNWKGCNSRHDPNYGLVSECRSIFFWSRVLVYPIGHWDPLWRNDCLTPIHQYWARSECHPLMAFITHYTLYMFFNDKVILLFLCHKKISLSWIWTQDPWSDKLLCWPLDHATSLIIWIFQYFNPHCIYCFFLYYVFVCARCREQRNESIVDILNRATP